LPTPSSRPAVREQFAVTGPAAEAVDRFRASLDPIAAPGERIGLAVSGGPDSLALLVLAAAARPGGVEAATVDHGLRAESGAEAAMVAEQCARLGVPHRILTVEWAEKPESGLQERSRMKRYTLLGDWAAERGLAKLVTAHHIDDQAETLLMRLVRGAGVGGLSAMRRLSRAPVGSVALARPLLGWQRSELEQVCVDAGLSPVDDPSNSNQQFERVRVRVAMAQAQWLDPAAIAASAGHLAEADAALDWATAMVWRRTVRCDGEQLLFQAKGIPREIRRRVVARAVARLASEGVAVPLRGRELDRLLAELAAGRKATLRGVLCSGGGEQWRFQRAPARSA
jgi:tRNA(Ile)-lysidine synthase